MDTSPSPNLYTVLIALTQMIGTAFTVWIAYKSQTRKQSEVAETLAIKVESTTDATNTKLDDVQNTVNRKIDDVQTTVNGNLDRERQRVAKLAKLLRVNGIEPDNFPD